MCLNAVFSWTYSERMMFGGKVVNSEVADGAHLRDVNHFEDRQSLGEMQQMNF